MSRDRDSRKGFGFGKFLWMRGCAGLLSRPGVAFFFSRMGRVPLIREVVHPPGMRAVFPGRAYVCTPIFHVGRDSGIRAPHYRRLPGGYYPGIVRQRTTLSDGEFLSKRLSEPENHVSFSKNRVSFRRKS
jgi:hypothetical protein